MHRRETSSRRLDEEVGRFIEPYAESTHRLKIHIAPQTSDSHSKAEFHKDRNQNPLHLPKQFQAESDSSWVRSGCQIAHPY